MKTITINVSEPVYRAFQRLARRTDRTVDSSNGFLIQRPAVLAFLSHVPIQEIHP